MFELRGASGPAGDVAALHRIGLTIIPGRTTALIGSSACGKSTVLRLMVGLIQSTARWSFEPASDARSPLAPKEKSDATHVLSETKADP